MSDLRQAAQQALEALEEIWSLGFRSTGDRHKDAITALRAALAQQEQEPVAWSPALTYPNYEKERVWLNGKPRQEDVEYWSKNGNGITYGYTTPPRREWQSLSEEEIAKVWCGAVMAQSTKEPGLGVIGFARAVEAALKEKNNG